MPATAGNLRDLHLLHQRAKAIRDRLTSGPKTLAARQLALTARQSALEASRKSLQETRVHLKTKEHTVQSLNSKLDDLRGKLNQVKKNEEYKAIQNQIALDKNSIERIENEMLDSMEAVESMAKGLAAQEADVKGFAGEVGTLKASLDDQLAGQRQQLDELEAAIVGAESVIPEDLRERYRRTVKQHGSDAMAQVEYDRKNQIASCTGCYVAVTTHALTGLMINDTLSFCQTCGRILYLPENE